MASGSHPDYLEVLPERTGKNTAVIRIDAIRSMQVEASRYPILAKQRVVLIDDADCMNEAAENSLLKTLEEPEGAVTFLLITGARSSLLDTIVSRCMPLSFGTVPEDAMVEVLAGRGLATAEARELASLADGSIGRALALHEHEACRAATMRCLSSSSSVRWICLPSGSVRRRWGSLTVRRFPSGSCTST